MQPYGYTIQAYRYATQMENDSYSNVIIGEFKINFNKMQTSQKQKIPHIMAGSINIFEQIFYVQRFAGYVPSATSLEMLACTIGLSSL
jgi:hypothetical protein